MPEVNLYTGWRNNGTIASWRGHARFTANRSSKSDPNVYCTMECWDERSGGDSSSWEGDWKIRYRCHMRYDTNIGSRDAWSGYFYSDGSESRGVISWSENVPIGAHIDNIWCYLWCEVNDGGYNDASEFMNMSGFIQYNPTPALEFNPPSITSYSNTLRTSSPNISISWNAPSSNTKVGYYELKMYSNTSGVTGGNFFSCTVPASSRSFSTTLSKWEVRKIIEKANGKTSFNARFDVYALTMNTNTGDSGGEISSDHSLAGDGRDVTVIIDSSKYTEEHLLLCPKSDNIVYDAYCKMNLESVLYPRQMIRCYANNTYYRSGSRTIRYDTVFSAMPRVTEYATVDGPGYTIWKSGIYYVQAAIYINDKGGVSKLCLSVRSTKRNRYILETDARPTASTISAASSGVVYLEEGDYIYVNVYTQGENFGIKGGSGWDTGANNTNAGSLFRIMPIYYTSNVLTSI